MDSFLEKQELSVEDRDYIDNILVDESQLNDRSKTFDVVNGFDIATHKHVLNSDQTLSKHEIIYDLKKCDYRTSPLKIAKLLDGLFSGSDTFDGWWIYVAQHWTPKSINGVISRIVKQHQLGETTIHDPAKYFTSLIKRRPMRKRFRNINATYKRQ